MNNIERATQLAENLEEAAIEDGRHIGASDAEFLARALRYLTVLVEDGVISSEALGSARR